MGVILNFPNRRGCWWGGGGGGEDDDDILMLVLVLVVCRAGAGRDRIGSDRTMLGGL